MKRYLIYAALVVAGIIVGAASHSSTKATATPVTKTRTVTHTHTRVVERTPSVCIAALDGLRRSALTMSRGAQLGFDGAATYDNAKITAATAMIKQATTMASKVAPAYAACIAKGA